MSLKYSAFRFKDEGLIYFEVKYRFFVASSDFVYVSTISFPGIPRTLKKPTIY